MAHRVDVLRADARHEDRGVGRRGRQRDATGLERPGHDGERRRELGRHARRACPGESVMTQSVWHHSASVPSGRRASVRRRAQTLRKPVIAVEIESVAPSETGARMPSSAARTTQREPAFGVPRRGRTPAARCGSRPRPGRSGGAR